MISDSIKTLRWRLFHAWLSLKVFFIRRKGRIRFGFLIQELSQWKTESLFKAMLAHPKFEPILCISPSMGYPGAENKLIEYCIHQGYDYCLLDPGKTIKQQLKVDLVVPEKPYRSELYPFHQIDNNKTIPYVVIPYYLSTITEEWVVNQRVNLLCWKQFVDNESCREAWSRIHRLKGMNYLVTGLPVMDDLLTPKEDLQDVWPVHDGRKRIIYAPHHTIADLHWKGIGYSTFFEYGEFMLQMRDKYQDQVYFVFKPHPMLQKRLKQYWGDEKTSTYYAKWNREGVSHVEDGAYLSLFKYSDALIHDCASFTVEYMYMDHPVMYLVRDDCHADNMIPYAKEAFDLHAKGHSKEEIEQFIQDVILGKDPNAGRRKELFVRELQPPFGKTACTNIINAILGEEEYR